MKKKGFTLIELLAVIVILAVIALISTPLIMGTISKAKMNSLKDSAYGILKAAETKKAEELVISEGDTKPLIIKNLESETTLNYKGKKPKCGYVVVNNDVEKIVLSDGQYLARKNYIDKEIKVTKGTCSEIEKEILTIDKPIQEGLRAYYDGTISPVVENGKFVWKDQSGNHYDGVLQNFESIEKAWTGNGILFQNNNCNILLPSTLDNFPEKSYTIESYFELNRVPLTTTTYMKLILKRTQENTVPFLFIGTTNEIWYGAVVNTGNNSLYTSVKADAGKRHLLTQTYDWDKKLAIIYLDGKEIYRKTIESQVFTEHWTLGGSQNFQHVLDGTIYAARMYDKALTQEEIDTNYHIDILKYRKL